MKLHVALARILGVIEKAHGTHALATPIVKKLHEVIPEEDFHISKALDALREIPRVQPIYAHPDLEAYLDAIGVEIAEAGRRVATSLNRPASSYVVASYMLYLTFVIKYLDHLLQSGQKMGRFREIDLSELQMLFPGLDFSEN